MKNAAHPQLKELHFDNPRLSRVGIEVFCLKTLRQRAPAALLAAPQRVDFYHLLFVTEGRHSHMVDFIEHELHAGVILLVRPGQVQQWRPHENLQGQLILISTEAFLPTSRHAEADMSLLQLQDWSAVAVPSQSLFAEAIADVRRLQADIERFDGAPLEAAIIRHELLTLLLRLARELRPDDAATPSQLAGTYRLFAKELELGFVKRLSVLEYAKRIGYSESSLSRACLAAVGRTAKGEIDERIALEAKRLLAHSKATTVQISHQLGFTEPTNFVKFFKRKVGVTPQHFRFEHVPSARHDDAPAAD
jgi:AraC-like DNA-binding protein